jgi:hypothetical protein
MSAKQQLAENRPQTMLLRSPPTRQDMYPAPKDLLNGKGQNYPHSMVVRRRGRSVIVAREDFVRLLLCSSMIDGVWPLDLDIFGLFIHVKCELPHNIFSAPHEDSVGIAYSKKKLRYRTMRGMFSFRSPFSTTVVLSSLTLLLWNNNSMIRPCASFQQMAALRGPLLVQQQQQSSIQVLGVHRRWPLLMGSSDDQEDDDAVPSPPAATAPPSTNSRVGTTGTSNSSNRPARSSSLDPLFTAVTKMDATTATAKTISIPLWGDLILDQSLFVLLPITAFAVLGILTSILILINSTDDFATAIQDMRAAASAINVDDDGNEPLCRGLCTNPNNVEGLRQYMMGISGNGK